MSVNNVPVCPTGCSTILPDLEFNFCSPVNSFGEISHVFLAALDAECFTDWTSSVEWLARLNNTSDDINAVRFMHVSADFPLGERDTIETSLCRKVKTPASYTLNIDVDDVADLNYTFMRASQCNTVFRMWFVAGDYLFGGNCGVEVILNLDYLIERGCKSIHKISGTATWEDPYAPERIANPLASTTLSD
jgi:hypothetical protein